MRDSWSETEGVEGLHRGVWKEKEKVKKKMNGMEWTRNPAHSETRPDAPPATFPPVMPASELARIMDLLSVAPALQSRHPPHPLFFS